MASEALVNTNILQGEQIVAALDAAGIPVLAAFWLLFEDTGTWKLWIATPKAGKDLQEAYVDVANVLASKGEPLDDFDLGTIKLVGPDEPLVKMLGSVIRVSAGAPVRFRGNSVNGIYLEDALIYRSAA